MDQEYDAFISYSQKDRPWVEKFVFSLEDKGADTWVDFSKIKPGQNIPQRINEGLKNSRFVLFVMTPESLKSVWTQTETAYVQMALEQERLIPVLLKDCSIPPLLLPIRYIDFRNPDDYQLKIRELLEVLEVPDKKRVWKKERERVHHPG